MGDEPKRETTLQQAMPSNPRTEPDLERIYRDHHRRVLSAAYRVTGSAQDAEDVLQTVFLRLVRREGGSPLSDSLGNYLHRAAVNAALDVVRSRKSRRSTPLEGMEPTLDAGVDASPEGKQAVTEVKDEIRRALSKMSAKAAEIFVLRYFEGYGNHEIATMLGTSRSTVNVILHRTRERLREELASYLGEKP
jgi:RNA polymerase sigma-70 factor (ECF subfamily)